MPKNASEMSALGTSKITVSTGARLHFGLVDTAAPFGGAGVMIKEPQTTLEFQQSCEPFSCTGPGCDRVAEVVERFRVHSGVANLPDCEVRVLQRPEPHTGLGSGTQLALATAAGLISFSNQDERSQSETTDFLQRVANRGKRSAVGTHGFSRGGFIFELPDSKSTKTALNRVVKRIELPASWRVGLFRPLDNCEAISGQVEQNQFGQLGAVSAETRSQLLRIVTEELLPAAETGDFRRFADAVSRYNYASGMMFADVQGGPYNGANVANLVQALNESNAVGTGQSSWGPTVFTWFDSDQSASSFVEGFSFPCQHVGVTSVLNEPRSIQVHGRQSEYPNNKKPMA